MSTKIWEAVRVPIKNLNEYLGLCREASTERIVKKVEMFVNNLKWDEFAPEVLKDVEETVSRWDAPDEEKRQRYLRWMKVEHLGRNVFPQASIKLSSTPFDIGASYNIWLSKGFAYIIPYGDAILPQADYVKDYHYQNQTDRPDNVSEGAYRRRGKKWDEIALNDWDATRLTYSVLEFSGTSWMTSIQHLLEAMKIL